MRVGLLSALALIMLVCGIRIVTADTYFCFEGPTLNPIRITLGQSSTLTVVVCNVGDPASVTIKVSSVSGPAMSIQPQDSISFQMDWGQWPAPLPNHQENFVLTPSAIGQCYGRLELYANNNLVDSRQFTLGVEPPQTQTEENWGYSAVTAVSTATITATQAQSTPVVINVNFEVFGVSAVSISIVAIISIALWKRAAKSNG